MTDVYAGHSEFVLLRNNRQRWFDGKTIFLVAIVSLPVIVFCGIYTIILKSNESVLYPKSHVDVPPLWAYRAKAYSHHPKHHNFKHVQLGRQPVKEIDEFKLVCYYNFPGDDLNALYPDDIDPFLCTHINVAFARIVNRSISLELHELKMLAAVVDLKLLNDKLKVLVSVGGAADDPGFGQMVRNHTNRKVFIKSVVDYVKDFKIDGLDLDWEFPNKEPGGDPHQKLHFTQLLEELRHTITKQHKHKFLLTAAVAAPAILIDQCYDVSYLNQFVDFVNVMTYDFHFYTKFTPFTGLNAPLFATPNEKGYFSTLNINYTVNYWISKGISSEKIVLGLPLFAHTFRLTNPHNKGFYAPARGYGKLGSVGFADYTQVCKFLTMNQITPIFDMDAKSPYASKNNEWVSFDNEQSLSFKAEYVRDHHLGGAMVYSLNADDHMGACKLNVNLRNEPFPLVKKVREILDKNYSLF